MRVLETARDAGNPLIVQSSVHAVTGDIAAAGNGSSIGWVALSFGLTAHPRL